MTFTAHVNTIRARTRAHNTTTIIVVYILKYIVLAIENRIVNYDLLRRFLFSSQCSFGTKCRNILLGIVFYK